MSGGWVTPEEVRAAAETYDELGPGYQDAVIEAFLDKVGREINTRVDTAVMGQQAIQSPGTSRLGTAGYPMALAVVSLILGIPISAIAVAAGRHPAGLPGLFVVWLAIAVINIAYNAGYQIRSHHPLDRR